MNEPRQKEVRKVNETRIKVHETNRDHHGCRNVPFAGEQRRGSRVRFPKEERCAESPPTFICGKRRENRRKPVKMKILSWGVVFTFEEGISTSHVCLKGQQPIF